VVMDRYIRRRPACGRTSQPKMLCSGTLCDLTSLAACRRAALPAPAGSLQSGSRSMLRASACDIVAAIARRLPAVRSSLSDSSSLLEEGSPASRPRRYAGRLPSGIRPLVSGRESPPAGRPRVLPLRHPCPSEMRLRTLDLACSYFLVLEMIRSSSSELLPLDASLM